MFFFFRRKPIYVDLFATDGGVFEYSKPDYANRFIPEWLTKTKGINNEGKVPFPTIKRCPGLLDTFKRGIIKPLWQDLMIEVSAQEKMYWWYAADGVTANIDSHKSEQWDTFVSPDDFAHMKLNSPWLIKTKEDVHWQTMPCYWNERMQPNYHVVPGIINTKFVHNMNVNIFMRYNPSRKFMISHGTPIDHYMPLTDRPIKIKHHFVSQQEYRRIDAHKYMFIGPHNSEVADDRKKKSKCPFGF